MADETGWDDGGGPHLRGYHHLSITVSDLARSTAWWSEVLGFTVYRQFELDGMTKVVMRHPGSGIWFSLTSHGSRTSGDQFTEFRTGMDHLAFAVPHRADLERWEAHFAHHGVEHSEIHASVVGDLITFRDPDNIQFEVYADTKPVE